MFCQQNKNHEEQCLHIALIFPDNSGAKSGPVIAQILMVCCDFNKQLHLAIGWKINYLAILQENAFLWHNVDQALMHMNVKVDFYRII